MMKQKKSLIELKNVDRKKLVYKTNEYTYSFENFQTIKTFGKDIYLPKSWFLRKKTKTKSPGKKTRERNCSWKLI